VVGLFVYEVMVVRMGHFSASPGPCRLPSSSFRLSFVRPRICCYLVPDTLREAARALGLPRSIVIGKVAYRAARAGLVTGVILAIARISGETAPLLFTALNNQFFSTNCLLPCRACPP